MNPPYEDITLALFSNHGAAREAITALSRAKDVTAFDESTVMFWGGAMILMEPWEMPYSDVKYRLRLILPEEC